MWWYKVAQAEQNVAGGRSLDQRQGRYAWTAAKRIWAQYYILTNIRHNCHPEKWHTICMMKDSRWRLMSVVDVSNPLVGNLAWITWPFQVESSQLHCTDLSMIPNVLIHHKFCSSHSYQQPFKLQSWHTSQSISDHADGDVPITRDTTMHAARAFWWI